MGTLALGTPVTEQPTPASIWEALAGSAIGDELLEWPADLFALTHLILERSASHRFAFSPPDGASWPPDDVPDWPDAIAEASGLWTGWIEDRNEPFPDLLAREWELLRDGADASLEDLAEARDWRLCQALLTLHAIADEACAGLGVALTASSGRGSIYRAHGRELLARTGTLARIRPDFLRVLPKVRTSLGGSSSRRLSRYACVHDAGVGARWLKVPGRRSGTEPQAQNVNFLLLPWPLRVRVSDFRAIEGSVRGSSTEPFGFFEFAPAEGLDFDLADRLLMAAREEAGCVDVVCLPESAVDERELADLEALLTRHGVTCLVAGVRQRPEHPGQMPGNWVHLGQVIGDNWLHIRQNKHHRWSLDERQIYQYHLGGVLHPHVRWWEAMEIPRRSIQFVEVGDGITVVSLVCEDLAQIDNVADLLRSVGPTIVITPLLDGPQLTSRWSARYASVLADDPGSAVLTLTSAGMAARSRPHGREASPVIALWKDPVRGTREIPLEAGAQGVLLTASLDLATRQSSDGRRPVQNCTAFFDVGIHQVQAAGAGSRQPESRPVRLAAPVLEAEELTVLTSWAEAVAEALAFTPERVEALLADLGPDAEWRPALGLPPPAPRLGEAIESVCRLVRGAEGGRDEKTLGGVLAATRIGAAREPELDRVARHLLQSALEQRQMREARARG